MFPRICVLHLTNACNLRCRHCYASAGERKKNELTLEEIKDVVDQLSELSTQYIILSGGEPFLRKEFYEIAQYCIDKEMNVMVTSNGTLLDDSHAEKLVKLGIDSVQISLDSHIPERNDRFRGVPGAFKNAMRGIETCKKHGIRTSVMMTLSKFNYENLGEMIDFCAGLGVNAFGLERFVPEGRGKSSPDIELTAEELKRAFEIMLKKSKEYNNMIISTNDPLFQFVDKKAYNKMDIPSIAMACGGCSAGVIACTVTPEGNVTPCARLFVSVGNVREQSFRDIWENSDLLKDLRRRDKLKGKCGRCKYKNVCGGCRATPYHSVGDYHAEDPMCWLKESDIVER
jgi:radical SAM protein with 4Fe4S-binding SPASM domain